MYRGWRSDTAGELACILSAGVAAVVAPLTFWVLLTVVAWLTS
jgi:hypothetical protein